MPQIQIKLASLIFISTKKFIMLKLVMPIHAIVQKVKMTIRYFLNKFHGLCNEEQQDLDPSFLQINQP